MESSPEKILNKIWILAVKPNIEIVAINTYWTVSELFAIIVYNFNHNGLPISGGLLVLWFMLWCLCFNKTCINFGHQTWNLGKHTLWESNFNICASWICVESVLSAWAQLDSGFPSETGAGGLMCASISTLGGRLFAANTHHRAKFIIPNAFPWLTRKILRSLEIERLTLHSLVHSICRLLFLPRNLARLGRR